VRKKRGGDIELLEVGSPIAGAFASVDYADGETTTEKGDLLVLYTDGVVEARKDGKLLGEERLVKFIRGMEPLSPRSCGIPAALSDDVAIVSVAWRGHA
jgi:serine phosphatase RsbU (regulator of sigma subunit)